MSRFPFTWYGNKRREVDHILPHIPPGAKTVVEPFAGSAAVSMEHWARSPRDGNVSYVLGDIDPGLCAFYRSVREHGLGPLLEWTRARLNERDWLEIDGSPDDGSVEHYYYRRRVTRPRFSKKSDLPKWPSLSLTGRQLEGEAFIRSAPLTIINASWQEVAAPYESDPTAVIYLDPPYFSSFNQTYYGCVKTTDDHGAVIDATQLYVDLKDLMERARAQIILSTNGLAIMRAIYTPYVVQVYPFRYSGCVKREDGKYTGKLGNHLLAVKAARPDLRDEDVTELLAGLGIE